MLWDCGGDWVDRDDPFEGDGRLCPNLFLEEEKLVVPFVFQFAIGGWLVEDDGLSVRRVMVEFESDGGCSGVCFDEQVFLVVQSPAMKDTLVFH